MPIITPAYPSMCSTHNVTASTQMIMTEEFKRGQFILKCKTISSRNKNSGAEIVDRVIVGSAKWSELFSKHDFFHKYRYYLQIIASTGNADLQMKWFVNFCNENHGFDQFFRPGPVPLNPASGN
jgi:poly(A) polymerase